MFKVFKALLSLTHFARTFQVNENLIHFHPLKDSQTQLFVLNKQTRRCKTATEMLLKYVIRLLEELAWLSLSLLLVRSLARLFVHSNEIVAAAK